MKMSNFRWKVAWLIFIVSFVSYMDRVNLSVATPVIMKEYGFDSDINFDKIKNIVKQYYIWYNIKVIGG